MLAGPADMARAIFSCVVSTVFAGIPLLEVCDSARLTNLIPVTRNRATTVIPLAKKLTSRTLGSHIAPPDVVSQSLKMSEETDRSHHYLSSTFITSAMEVPEFRDLNEVSTEQVCASGGSG